MKKKRTTRRPEITPRGLTKEEAAVYLGCGKNSLEKLVKLGRLRPVRYQGIRRDYFDRDALDLLIDQAATGTVPTTVPTMESKYGFLRVARGGR
jgi:excisionase family DNA binding protein